MVKIAQTGRLQDAVLFTKHKRNMQYIADYLNSMPKYAMYNLSLTVSMFCPYFDCMVVDWASGEFKQWLYNLNNSAYDAHGIITGKPVFPADSFYILHDNDTHFLTAYPTKLTSVDYIRLAMEMLLDHYICGKPAYTGSTRIYQRPLKFDINGDIIPEKEWL